MEIFQAIGTDAALVIFSAAGLLATAIAIVADTKTQKAGLAGGSVPIEIDR